MDYFSNYTEAHLKVIDTLKTALYQKDKTIFDKLDFYDDDVFSEPLLFACINNNEYDDWIDTIVFGLSKDREKLTNVKSKVFANNALYIPKIGNIQLKTNLLLEYVFLNFSNDSLKICDHNQTNINFEISTIKTDGTGIEFFDFHPLLEKLYVNEQGKVVKVKINNGIYDKHILQFEKALDIIKNLYSEYHNLVKKYIKKVVFYEGEPNSFATIQAHGIAFFNVREEYDAVFFLDNILHQCAHVFFNVLTFDKNSLFNIPYNSDLSIFTGDDEDKGFSLYDRFHGLFTQTNINVCIDRCLSENILEAKQKHELLGRFTNNMNRFSSAINKFNKPEKYKKSGQKWFTFFNETYLQILLKNKEVLERYDLSNQPYVFSYEIFEKTNPIN